MGRDLPTFLAFYLPKGHRLWVAKEQGALRMDWLMCTCGVGVKLEKVPGPSDKAGNPTTVTEDVTDEHWLTAVNQCRMAVHTTRAPCPPITLDGAELPVRELPPAVQPVAVTAPPVEEKKRKAGRPKKEAVHAA